MKNQEEKPIEFEPLTYLPLYVDTMAKVEYLMDEEVGRLTRLLLRYAATGVVPTSDEMPGNERLVFAFFRLDVDRARQAYLKKCTANRLNGKKGGRPPKKTKEIQKTQEQEHEQGQDHDQEQDQPQEQTPGHPKDHSHTKDHIQDHPQVDEDGVVCGASMPAIYREPKDLGLPF